MSRSLREFIKVEIRLLNDHRFFLLGEFEQLLYIKLLSIAKVTMNRIPKDCKIIGAYARTNRSESDIESALYQIKEKFEKFKENKYFFYFEEFGDRHDSKGLKSYAYNCEEEEKEEEKEKEEEHDGTLPKNSFDTLWIKYPNKVGKKQAERHYKTSVKTKEDYDNICRALENYLKSERVAKGFVQNASTWFNNWADWIEYTEEVCPKCKGKGKYTSSTGYEIVCDCK